MFVGKIYLCMYINDMHCYKDHLLCYCVATLWCVSLIKSLWQVRREDSSNFQHLWLAYPRLAGVPTSGIFESVVAEERERKGGGGRGKENRRRRWTGVLEGFRTTEVCGIVSIWLDILLRRSTLPQPRQDLEICFLCAAFLRWMCPRLDTNTTLESMLNFLVRDDAGWREAFVST